MRVSTVDLRLVGVVPVLAWAVRRRFETEPAAGG